MFEFFKHSSWNLHQQLRHPNTNASAGLDFYGLVYPHVTAHRLQQQGLASPCWALESAQPAVPGSRSIRQHYTGKTLLKRHRQSLDLTSTRQHGCSSLSCPVEVDQDSGDCCFGQCFANVLMADLS